MHEEINKAYETIINGGTFVYPTDTIWGLGCDATNPTAVEKIYKLKQRSESKSLIVLVNSDVMLDRYLQEVPEVAWDIIDNTDKPTTLVLPNPKGLAQNAIAADNTIGIRMVKDEFCYKLIQKLKRPIISTSANISGEPSPTCFNDISDAVLSAADYVVNLRRNETMTTPSSIIKLALNGEVSIIRK